MTTFALICEIRFRQMRRDIDPIHLARLYAELARRTGIRR